jgi:hypothetical protein
LWIDFLPYWAGGGRVGWISPERFAGKQAIGRDGLAQPYLGFTLTFFFNSLLYNKKSCVMHER